MRICDSAARPRPTGSASDIQLIDVAFFGTFRQLFSCLRGLKSPDSLRADGQAQERWRDLLNRSSVARSAKLPAKTKRLFCIWIEGFSGKGARMELDAISVALRPGHGLAVPGLRIETGAPGATPVCVIRLRSSACLKRAPRKAMFNRVVIYA